jgi:hypothetical protein
MNSVQGYRIFEKSLIFIQELYSRNPEVSKKNLMHVKLSNPNVSTTNLHLLHNSNFAICINYNRIPASIHKSSQIFI